MGDLLVLNAAFGGMYVTDAARMQLARNYSVAQSTLLRPYRGVDRVTGDVRVSWSADAHLARSGARVDWPSVHAFDFAGASSDKPWSVLAVQRALGNDAFHPSIGDLQQSASGAYAWPLVVWRRLYDDYVATRCAMFCNVVLHQCAQRYVNERLKL
jgi:hypothetical protein